MTTPLRIAFLDIGKKSRSRCKSTEMPHLYSHNHIASQFESEASQITTFHGVKDAIIPKITPLLNSGQKQSTKSFCYRFDNIEANKYLGKLLDPHHCYLSIEVYHCRCHKRQCTQRHFGTEIGNCHNLEYARNGKR